MDNACPTIATRNGPGSGITEPMAISWIGLIRCSSDRETSVPGPGTESLRGHSIDAIQCVGQRSCKQNSRTIGRPPARSQHHRRKWQANRLGTQKTDKIPTPADLSRQFVLDQIRKKLRNRLLARMRPPPPDRSTYSPNPTGKDQRTCPHYPKRDRRRVRLSVRPQLCRSMAMAILLFQS